MRSGLAIVALAGAYLACFVIVRLVRRRASALAAPIALALLVGLEAVLLRALSAFEAVRAGPVLAAHLALLAAGLSLAARFPAALGRPWRVRWRWPALPLAVLFCLAATSALVYRPNNWDSMTYHLARVAHWIQHGSVAVYPTGIPRQNLLTPGAEYLLLVLQVISGSDRLASLVQLGAWALLVLSVTPLARTFGAPRGVARATAVVVGAAPLAVLEASSTQNDLVAAVMVAAVAIAAVPFLHRRRRWRAGDPLLLLAAIVGGILVKTPCLLFVAPLVLAAGAGWLRGVGGWRGLLQAAPALALALALAPTLAATARAAAPVTGRYVYAGLSEPTDRVVNVVRGTLRNLPLWEAAGDLVAPVSTEGCDRPRRLCLAQNRAPHEDTAGNPGVALLALGTVALAAARWRRVGHRARLGVVALALGWLLFHALMRDNTWITRLQLPALAMVAIAAGALPRGAASGTGRFWLGALTAAAVAHGAWAAVRDVRRPLFLRALRRLDGASAYYIAGPPGVAAQHAQVLEALRRSGCRRLGLYLGGDSYDYPLTWRAMGMGVEVRHLLAADGWPCAVFSDRGEPPTRPDGRPWRAAAPTGYFVDADATAAAP